MIRAATIGLVPIDPPVPPWIAALPRHRLFDGPSPLSPLPRLSAALGDGVELWIKREDLLPLAFGGNKLRNLEFLVGAALAEGADTLITTGRRWSNHARLTAAAGAQAGLEVHLVLSGPATDPPNPGVVLDGLLGAVVHQTATDDRTEREAMVERVVADLRAAGRRPYVIGVGGSGAIGAAGQVLAAIEADAQARAAGVAFDRIVLPTATGGTQAGLIVGTAVAGSDALVTGMTVARPADELRPSIAAHGPRPGRDGGHGAGAGPARPAHRPRRPGVRRRLRPAERRGRRRDPAPRPLRGDPRGPDLHGEGAGRAARPGALGRARRPARPVLARRRRTGPVRAARPGLTGAGRRAAMRPATPARARPYFPADRQASRSLIRPPIWRTAPA